MAIVNSFLISWNGLMICKKRTSVWNRYLKSFFYYSGTSLVIMMISPIGSSCFKSDLDCDQILHIQWGSLFPASTSVVDGKIGRFIFCVSTDRIWDYLGSILRSGRYSKIDKSNTWVTCTSIRILEFFSKNNKLPGLYDVSNLHHLLEERRFHFHLCISQ